MREPECGPRGVDAPAAPLATKRRVLFFEGPKTEIYKLFFRCAEWSLGTDIPRPYVGVPGHDHTIRTDRAVEHSLEPVTPVLAPRAVRCGPRGRPGA